MPADERAAVEYSVAASGVGTVAGQSAVAVADDECVLEHPTTQNTTEYHNIASKLIPFQSSKLQQ